jgi:hypothetical protein
MTPQNEPSSIVAAQLALTYVSDKVKGMDWRKNKTVVMGMV